MLFCGTLISLVMFMNLLWDMDLWTYLDEILANFGLTCCVCGPLVLNNNHHLNNVMISVERTPYGNFHNKTCDLE